MKNFLFITQNKAHLTIATKLATVLKDKKISKNFIYHPVSSDISENTFDAQISDIRTLPAVVETMDLILFSVLETDFSCRASIIIYSLASKLGVPTLCMQHGMIQPGLNFFYNHEKANHHGLKPIKNFSEKKQFTDIVHYFGDSGIGYPLIDNKNLLKTAVNREGTRGDKKVLIATNFNWDIYTYEDIFNFSRIISLLKSNNDNFTLHHGPHPAEKFLKDSLKKMTLTLEDIGIDQVNNHSSSLEFYDFVITTPSTIYLDALSCGIPVFMYFPKTFNFHEYVNVFNSEILTFSNHNELQFLIEKYIFENKKINLDIFRFKEDKFLVHVNAAITKKLNRLELNPEIYLEFMRDVKSLL